MRVETELLEKIKTLMPETKGLNYTALVDVILRTYITMLAQKEKEAKQ